MTRGMHAKQQAGMAAAATTKTFAIGNKVKWSSQAMGSWKEKEGTVVDVVPPKKVTQMMRSLDLGAYNFRKHESYIVHVPAKSGRGKGTYYWPLVSKLQRV